MIYHGNGQFTGDSKLSHRGFRDVFSVGQIFSAGGEWGSSDILRPICYSHYSCLNYCMFPNQAFLQWSSYGVQGNVSTRRFLGRNDDEAALFKICVFVCTPKCAGAYVCKEEKLLSQLPSTLLFGIEFLTHLNLRQLDYAWLASEISSLPAPPPAFPWQMCTTVPDFLTWDLWDAGSHTYRANTLLTELSPCWPGALILSSWVLGFLLLLPFTLWTLVIQSFE